jgi:hypothetical protein
MNVRAMYRFLMKPSRKGRSSAYASESADVRAVSGTGTTTSIVSHVSG